MRVVGRLGCVRSCELTLAALRVHKVRLRQQQLSAQRWTSERKRCVIPRKKARNYSMKSVASFFFTGVLFRVTY